MEIIDDRGWLLNVERCPSPNYGQRPVGIEVSLLVIHNISLPEGQFGNSYIRELFCNALDCSKHPDFADLRDLQVSAHLLISREGELCQFVSFDDRAWHAGVSSFQGRLNCNDFSVGIELEGADHIPYTANQYESLSCVTRALQYHYPLITAERIVGHSEIAPGRKTDPGGSFDWHHYKKLLG